MTVETTSGGEPIVKSGPYTGDGVTTSFDYDFQVQDEAELVVTRQNADGTEAVLTITTDYTVSGVSNDAGGSITLTAGSKAPSGSKIVIQYDGLYTQSVDYSNQGRIQLSLLEQSLDKLMMHCRSLKEIADRAVTVDAFNTVDVDTLRANINALAAIESDITTVAANIAAVTSVSGNTTNINTVAGIAANVTTVAGIAANVTTVAGAILNVNTVATNIADIGTVAGIAVDVSAVAANLADISAVAAIAADVTTVAGLETNIATVASLEADIVTLTSGTGGTVTGTWDFSGDVNFTTTGAIRLPVGTTAQRPVTPVQGDTRFNSTDGTFEGYDGTAWGSIGGADFSSVGESILPSVDVTYNLGSSTFKWQTGYFANISDGTTSVGTEYVVNGSAKAWVHILAASGIPSIAGSYNVSSVTDLSVGRVGVNFTNAMANNGYAWPASSNLSENGAYSYTTTSVNMYTNGSTGSPLDPDDYSGTGQGDLA